MSLEQLFSADIHEHPEDDTPRLILADWLEDQPGPAQQARGELIRIQCRLARMLPGDPDQFDLEMRQLELTARYASIWLEPILTSLLNEDHQRLWLLGCCSFRRGLIHLWAYSETLLRRICQGLERGNAWNWVEGISTACEPELIRHLTACPAASQITTLEITRGRDEPKAEAIAALFASRTLVNLSDLTLRPLSNRALMALEGLAHWPQLERLCSLSLEYCYIPLQEVEFLARSPLLRNLRRLRYLSTEMPSSFLLPLACSPRLASLEELSLAGTWQDGPAQFTGGSKEAVWPVLKRLELENGLASPQAVEVLLGAQPEGLRCLELAAYRPHQISGISALARTAVRRSLLALRVTGCGRVTSDDWRALARPGGWPQLRSLRVPTYQAHASPAALLRSDLPASLTALALPMCGLDNRMTRVLGRGPSGKLAALDLTRNDISGPGIDALLELPGLRRLCLRENSLGQKGTARLVANPALARLVQLDLSQNRLRADGGCLIAESPHLAGLLELGLEGSEIKDAGALAVAHSPHLHNLLRLDLRKNSFLGDEVGLALADPRNLKRLVELDLSRPNDGSGLGVSGKEALQRRVGAGVHF